jgi:hypothetical protein
MEHGTQLSHKLGMFASSYRKVWMKRPVTFDKYKQRHTTGSTAQA